MLSMHEVMELREKMGMNGSTLYYCGLLQDLDHEVIFVQTWNGEAYECYPGSDTRDNPNYVGTFNLGLASSLDIYTPINTVPIKLFGLLLLRHPTRSLRELRCLMNKWTSGCEEGGYYEEVAGC